MKRKPPLAMLKLESIQEQDDESVSSEPSWKRVKAVKRAERIRAKR